MFLRTHWRLFNVFIIIVLFFSTTNTSAQETHWMPDPNLRSAVREQLKIPDGIPMLIPDLQRLHALVVFDGNITNLQGLEHATNLHFLHVAPARIQDFTPILELENLKVLKVYSNGLEDVSQVSEITNLEVLQLQSNQIKDISPLAKLRNLKELSLQFNQIEDFTPLLNLTKLEILYAQGNPGDMSPLLTLNLPTFRVCDVIGKPTNPRVENRDYPSVFAAWANIINIPTLSNDERLTYHDLYFCCPMFGLHFTDTDQGIVLAGNVEAAKKQREVLKKQNPNLVLLVAVHYYTGLTADSHVPEDSPMWLRDEDGNRVVENFWNEYLLDFTHPETQDWAVQQAIAVAECGLFDGIFFDHWNEHPRLLGYQTLEAEYAARDTILRRIRASVRDDFLIMVNANDKKIPKWAAHINGLFMETIGDVKYSQQRDPFEAQGYTYARLQEIEDTLTWAEDNLKAPRINGLEGFAISRQEPDTPANKQWMRVFTTMSLTHSDGYVLYNIGNASLQHTHEWTNPHLDAVWGILTQSHMFMITTTTGTRFGMPPSVNLSEAKQHSTKIVKDFLFGNLPTAGQFTIVPESNNKSNFQRRYLVWQAV